MQCVFYNSWGLEAAPPPCKQRQPEGRAVSGAQACELGQRSSVLCLHLSLAAAVVQGLGFPFSPVALFYPPGAGWEPESRGRVASTRQ